MNRVLMVILFLAVLGPKTASADCANVYWIPFDAELYAPESEGSIESRAFERGTIPSVVADSLVSQSFSIDQARDYNPGNVRVLIRSSKKETYIDRFGWVRQGNLYGRVDVSEIESKLSVLCAK